MSKAAKKVPLVKPSYLNKMVRNAQIGLNTMLVGPAGCGKTYAANMLAEEMDRPFQSVNLTAGASETWLFGRQTPVGFVEGGFSKMYRNGGVFLADEMDAADANLMLSINTALSSAQMYNPILGEMIKRHKDFVFVGAANTFGKGGSYTYSGRTKLDAATLDRFVMIQVDYEDAIEQAVLDNTKLLDFAKAVRGEIKKRQSIEFLSTRALITIDKQMSAGISALEAVEGVVVSWSDEIRKKAIEMVDLITGKKELPKPGTTPLVDENDFDKGWIRFSEERLRKMAKQYAPDEDEDKIVNDLKEIFDSNIYKLCKEVSDKHAPELKLP